MQQGFIDALQLQSLLMMLLGTLIGTFAGIIPGLSSGMSVALFLPLTFTMSPLHGIIFLISIYVSVGYGGALTAILLNTPGSPQNAVTTLDGFELTKQGRAAEALGVSISSSVYGGLLSYFAMLASIGFVATVALKFGPVEMFLIAIAGVTVLGAVGSASVAKTMASGVFGLLIGTIGIVPTGEWRATFNEPYLADGLPIIPVLIGMFVFSELMLMAFREYVIDFDHHREAQPAGYLRRISPSGLGAAVAVSLDHPRHHRRPAAGRRRHGGFVRRLFVVAQDCRSSSEEYGKGSVEGVVASESANNACSGGDIMTTLVLGVPGSATTGILLGALTMHGLQAGPNFVAQQQTSSTASSLLRSFRRSSWWPPRCSRAYSLSGTLSVPTRILVPILMLFSVVGAYASRNAAFDVYLMLVFGALGFLMKRTGYSPAAVVMGVILSSIADNELIRMFQLYGDDWYLAVRVAPDRCRDPGAVGGNARLERHQQVISGRQAHGTAGCMRAMKIGVPKEIKDNEFRVGLTPAVFAN